MARWIPQTFTYGDLKISLASDHVSFTREMADGSRVEITIKPVHQTHAHDMAHLLRKAARRFEEIGRGLL